MNFPLRCCPVSIPSSPYQFYIGVWGIMSVRWPRLLNPSQLCQILKHQKNPLTSLHLFREVKSRYTNYRHNGPVYATMISILGNSGRISEMKEIIQEMKMDSCQCKDSVFASVIRTYARYGLIDDAMELFRSLPDFNCVNWTESFNTILQVMINESRFEDAHRLFSDNSSGWGVKCRLRSLNMLMDALCRRGCSELALQLFQEMNLQGCYPDRDSYHILMRGLCSDGRLHEATHLLYSMFWRISQKGSGGDIIVYRTLLDALCDHGQIEEAAEILNKILRKGLKSKRVAPCLDVMRCTAEGIEVTKALVSECLMRGVIPSSASYNAMAVDLYGEGKIDEAEKVMSLMRSKGFKPSRSVYEGKLAALCQRGELEEARQVIDEEMVKDNFLLTRRSFNILLQGLCHHDNSITAVEYLEKSAKRGDHVANRESYEILLSGLLGEDQFAKASEVLEKMVINAHPPRAEFFKTVIRGLCSVGRQYEAVMWLEEMVSRAHVPEVSVWTSLVSSVCSKTTSINVP